VIFSKPFERKNQNNYLKGLEFIVILEIVMPEAGLLNGNIACVEFLLLFCDMHRYGSIPSSHLF
jgi:hypothetical protein